MTDIDRPGPEGPQGDGVEAHDREALERQRLLGARLRDLWEIDQDLPQEFMDLLSRLDDDGQPESG